MEDSRLTMSLGTRLHERRLLEVGVTVLQALDRRPGLGGRAKLAFEHSGGMVPPRRAGRQSISSAAIAGEWRGQQLPAAIRAVSRFSPPELVPRSPCVHRFGVTRREHAFDT
jgi:hypothetical protein